MPRNGDDRPGNLVCSFCGKSQDEVRKLIAGPTVYICDECIDLCNELSGKLTRKTRWRPPQPSPSRQR